MNGYRQTYEERVTGLDKKRAELEQKAVEGELHKLESRFLSLQHWQQGLKGLRKALASGDVDVRRRLQVHLRQLIDKIELFAVGFDKVAGHAPAAVEASL